MPQFRQNSPFVMTKVSCKEKGALSTICLIRVGSLPQGLNRIVWVFNTGLIPQAVITYANSNLAAKFCDDQSNQPDKYVSFAVKWHIEVSLEILLINFIFKLFRKYEINYLIQNLRLGLNGFLCDVNCQFINSTVISHHKNVLIDAYAIDEANCWDFQF